MQRSKLRSSRNPFLVSSIAIAACLLASNHAVAGIVVAFGDNSYNQLGNSSAGYSSDVPVFAQDLSNNVTGLAEGTYYTVVIDNGVVKAWGSGTLGELGNGVAANSTTPVNVTGLGTGVTQIASGITHVLAIQNGGVVSWGEGDDGEMGNGTTNFTNLVPVHATGLSTGVTAVAAGQWNSVAIQNGAVKMWGYGYNTTPGPIGGLTSNVTAISAGQSHDLAIQNGAALAWGNGGDHAKPATSNSSRQGRSSIGCTYRRSPSCTTAVSPSPSSCPAFARSGVRRSGNVTRSRAKAQRHDGLGRDAGGRHRRAEREGFRVER